MKIILLFLTILCGCRADIPTETPSIPIPAKLRQQNYNGGSCVWASTISLLNWQGLPRVAQYVRANRSGGEYDYTHGPKMDSLGLRHARTTDGDVGFLEWCIKTRRGAGIVWSSGRHMINLIGLTATTATLLDNNDTENLIQMPRDEMITKWRQAGGWAFTVVYAPAAPLPVPLKWELR